MQHRFIQVKVSYISNYNLKITKILLGNNTGPFLLKSKRLQCDQSGIRAKLVKEISRIMFFFSTNETWNFIYAELEILIKIGD